MPVGLLSAVSRCRSLQGGPRTDQLRRRQFLPISIQRLLHLRAPGRQPMLHSTHAVAVAVERRLLASTSVLSWPPAQICEGMWIALPRVPIICPPPLFLQLRPCDSCRECSPVPAVVLSHTQPHILFHKLNSKWGLQSCARLLARASLALATDHFYHRPATCFRLELMPVEATIYPS